MNMGKKDGLTRKQFEREGKAGSRKRNRILRKRRRDHEVVNVYHGRHAIKWDFTTFPGRLAYINEHLKACRDCGETDYRLLTFHHRDPRSKRWNIKAMAREGATKGQIDDEIAKCDVLCFNCHRLVHWSWDHQRLVDKEGKSRDN